jgi:putative heme iron utilization protein
MFGNKGKKSWLIFELVAQRRESAVEVIAAMIAQIAKIKTVGEVTFKSKGIKGLVDDGKDIFFIFAYIPKNTGMQAKRRINMLDKNAEIVATVLFLAAKNL